MLKSQKNILAIIGSNNKNSESEQIFQKIFKNINLNFNYNLDKINLNNLTLNYCTGCKNCFDFRNCILDDNDDMSIIRNKLKKADIIFFIVPVYAHDVPGKMKTLIDRLSYEFHFMGLHGKLGISIVITDISGAERVSDYIYDIFTNLGIKQLGSYIYKHCLDNDACIFRNIGGNISKNINNNEDFTNPDLEYFFEYYKKKYINGKGFVSHFWNKSEVVTSNNFQEFCTKIKDI